MNEEIIPWQIIVSLIGVAVQLLIAERSKRKIKKDSENNLEMQRFVSHRSVASVVADKRQKWIDELRADMASHLALSKEIVWGWDAVRSNAILEAQEKPNENAQKIWQDAADSFSPVNGERDRKHEELHFRIKFRLNPNPKEDLDAKILKCLDDVRNGLDELQGAKNEN